MEINRASLDAIFATYSTAFNNGFTGSLPSESKPTAVKLNTFAMEAEVGGSAVTHTWLETLPKLAKWVGTRTMKNISSKKLTVSNDSYANGVSVKRTDIADDVYGVYAPLIRAMGVDARRLWQRLAIEALVTNGNWADGAAFFGTSRTYGSNTISNKTTSALDATTFKAAYEALTGFVDSEGEPLEVEPAVLLVGPKLYSTAFDLVKNTLVTAGSSKGGAVQNWAQGICELQVSNRLVGAYDDYWFLLGESKGLMPVFIQKREEAKLRSQTDDGSDAVFLRDEFNYGVDARGASFLTLPHLAYAGIL
jgi:phage major head subunit gpT-like protein